MYITHIKTGEAKENTNYRNGNTVVASFQFCYAHEPILSTQTIPVLLGMGFDKKEATFIAKTINWRIKRITERAIDATFADVIVTKLKSGNLAVSARLTIYEIAGMGAFGYNVINTIRSDYIRNFYIQGVTRLNDGRFSLFSERF